MTWCMWVCVVVVFHSFINSSWYRYGCYFFSSFFFIESCIVCVFYSAPIIDYGCFALKISSQFCNATHFGPTNVRTHQNTKCLHSWLIWFLFSVLCLYSFLLSVFHFSCSIFVTAYSPFTLQPFKDNNLLTFTLMNHKQHVKYDWTRSLMARTLIYIYIYSRGAILNYHFIYWMRIKVKFPPTVT